MRKPMRKWWAAVVTASFLGLTLVVDAAEQQHRGAPGAEATDKGNAPGAAPRRSTPPPAPKTRVEAQSQYEAAVINCNKEAGFAKTDCMKKAAKARDQAMASLKPGAGDPAHGVAGRAGAPAPDPDTGANSASGIERKR